MLTRMKRSRARAHPGVWRRGACVPFFALMTISAHAAGNLSIEPSINTRATYSDGRNGTNGADSDYMFEITPSIRLARDRGALTGGFTFSLRNAYYIDAPESNTSFVTFQGNGAYEIIDDTFFIEARGNVSRQDRSLFSAQSDSDTFNTSASNETRLFSLSPRLQFRLGSTGEGQLRLEETWFSGGNGVRGSRRERSWVLNLSDGSAFGPLGWFADYRRNSTNYDDNVRETTRESGRLGLSYRVSPRFTLRSTVGREKNDFNPNDVQSKTTYGFGGDWNPTDRTSLTAFVEERLYGRGYDLQFRHRSRKTVWSLSFTRDYVASSSLVSTSANGYYYDYFYDLFAAQVPDPVQRDQVTRAFLAAIGLDALPQEISYVSESQSLRQAVRGSVVIKGIRNTVTVSLFRTQDERLSSDVVIAGDDFDGNSVIVRSGGGVSWTRQLSPKTSLNSSINLSDTKGSGSNAREQKLTTFRVGLTRRLGVKANGALIYSHTKREGDIAGDENQITASLGFRF